MGHEGALSVARAAGVVGVPFFLSSVNQLGMERVAREARGPKVFQLYVRGDDDFVDDHVRRAIDAGYDAFCITVDSAIYSRRERDLANRFAKPWRGNTPGMQFQAGLSWITILRKRDAFRAEFDGFDPARVALWDDARVARALTNPGIVRHRGKIEATGRGARLFGQIEAEEGFAPWLWSFVGGAPIQNAWPDMAAVPTETLAGALISTPGTIDLVVAGGGRFRAELGDDCPTLGFYSGFYLKPSADGRVCAGRDAVRARSGRTCSIRRFRRLQPRRPARAD
jgi:hypothetical protein